MSLSRPQFSVIVPLQNDRDVGPACVASWLAQTCPRDGYEIVLVTANARGRWERQLQAQLRTHDQFLEAPQGAETLMWDHGARQARGDWVLFTEAHCIADAHCLEEMRRYLHSHDVAGACCRSIGIAHSPAARIDERLFQQGFQQAIRPDNWRKLVMHGSVLSRRIFLDLGGFEPGLGRFAEWVLERRLHDAGHQLGYAEQAIVRHVYRDTLAELIPELVAYTEGECAFQNAQPDLRVADYTCFPPEWRTGHEPNTRLARAVAATLLGSLCGDLPLGRSSWWQFQAVRAAMQRMGILGQRMRTAVAWWALQWALFQAWRRRADEKKLEPAYRRLKEAIVRWARFRWLAQEAAPAPAPKLTVGHIAIAEVGDHALHGFHCLEKCAQGVFRWSRAVAALEFNLAPDNYQLRLRTGGLRGPMRPLLRDVFFNGVRIPLRHLGDQDHDPVIPLAQTSFQTRRPQQLVVVCQPVDPARLGPAERRELGLPLLGIELKH